MNTLDDLTSLISQTLGSEDSKPVLDTLHQVLQGVTLEKDKVPPVMNEGKTWGEWALSVPYVKEELRPFTSLSYNIIDTMLRTGIIRFAVDLKRAKMVSGFRNERSLQVHCADKPLADAALASLSRMLPQMVYEMSWSSLIYGTAFMETVWGTRTGYELGISDKKTSEVFSVPLQANLVPHRTIRAIRREEGGRFNGFVQNPAAYFHTHVMDNRTADLQGFSHTDIIVPAESALVVPYNGYSRNLWGESFLGPIYPLWFWYEIIMRCLVSFTQLMGDPPRLGKAPSKKKLQITSTGQTLDAVDYMMAVGVNLTKSNTAIIPSDVDPETKVPMYELAYMQMPDRSQPFVQILEHLNQQILRAALSGDKTLMSSPGGGAAIGELHAEATALHDEMIVSSWLHFINQYFVKYISVYNRGQGGPPIWLELQGLDPREQQLLSTVLGVAGNTQSFDDFFYSVDWKALGQLSGLPMLSEEAKAELKQKLNEEKLKNQADQQIMTQALTPPEQPPKKLQAKYDRLVDANPVVFSQDDLNRMHVEEEEPRKIWVVPEIKRDPKLAAAVAATMILEGVSDNDNPFGSVSLFNPYHDSLGRFASKAGGMYSKGVSDAKEFWQASQNRIGKAGEWVKENPKEALILGTIGVVALGVGIRDLTRTTSTGQSNGHAVNTDTTSGTTNTGVRVENTVVNTVTGVLLSEQAKQKLHTIGLTANAIVTDLGVKTTPDVYWHTTKDEWDTGWKKHNLAGKRIYKTSEAQGYRADDGTVHLSPDSSQAATNGAWNISRGVGLVAHELYHSRKNMPSYRGKNVRTEEELASVVQSIAASRVVNGGTGKFNKQDLSKAFWADAGKTGYPREYYYTLFRAAAFKYRSYKGDGKYNHITDVVSEWIRDKDPHMDVQMWVGAANFNRRNMPGSQNRKWSLESIQLFNPYHDSLGRFASKQGSAQLFGQSGTKPVSQGKVAQIVNNVSKEYGPLVKFETIACGDWSCVKKNTGSSSKDLLGSFSATEGKLVLAPGIGAMAERVVRHETIHARKRSQGGGVVFQSAEHRRVEEGCTELMTFKKVRAGTPYAKEMMMVAKAARNYSGGDPKRGWDFIQKVHYHNDTDVGVSAIRKYGGKGSEADVWWLLDSIKLEIAEDDRFARSEEAIYRDIREVKNKRVVSVPLPEDFDETGS